MPLLVPHCPLPVARHRLNTKAREGLGGGFNERQDRASVGTVEVDEDGYDDFGRKKNKARVDKKAKEVRAKSPLGHKLPHGEGAGFEVDDDDDDGDDDTWSMSCKIVCS